MLAKYTPETHKEKALRLKQEAEANKGAKKAMLDNPHLLAGLNVHRGMVTYEDVARDLGYDYVPAVEALKTA